MAKKAGNVGIKKTRSTGALEKISWPIREIFANQPE